jgi:hypothetical protein
LTWPGRRRLYCLHCWLMTGLDLVAVMAREETYSCVKHFELLLARRTPSYDVAMAACMGIGAPFSLTLGQTCLPWMLISSMLSNYVILTEL